MLALLAAAAVLLSHDDPVPATPWDLVVELEITAEDPPRRRLYVRRFDGSGDRILFSGGDGEYPVW